MSETLVLAGFGLAFVACLPLCIWFRSLQPEDPSLAALARAEANAVRAVDTLAAYPTTKRELSFQPLRTVSVAIAP